MRYCAYPFLKEKESLCDYEVETDALSSNVALSIHYQTSINRSDLLWIVEMIYHANGSIRGHCAITEQDLQHLSHLYDKYYIKHQQFVLPCGSEGSCYFHTLRSQCKKIVRILTRLEQEGTSIPNEIEPFFQLLSNVFFMMALYENKKLNIQEIAFQSKSYES